jgi:hypothetical protein
MRSSSTVPQHDGPPGNGGCRADRNPIASLLRGRRSEKTQLQVVFQYLGRNWLGLHSALGQFWLYVVRREYRNENHEPEMVARAVFVVLSSDHRLCRARARKMGSPSPKGKELPHGSGGWIFSGLRAWSRGHVPGRHARSVPQPQAERIIVPRPNRPTSPSA